MRRRLLLAAALAGIFAASTIAPAPAPADDEPWTCVWVNPIDRAVCLGDVIPQFVVPVPLGPLVPVDIPV